MTRNELLSRGYNPPFDIPEEGYSSTADINHCSRFQTCGGKKSGLEHDSSNKVTNHHSIFQKKCGMTS